MTHSIRIFRMIAFALLLLPLWASAQERKVQNRPYTDLRPFHFGIHIGTHLQDMELVNVGPTESVTDDGTVTKQYITCDQDRLDPGFNVGVLGELRLSQHLQLRIAPAIYFGSRHIVFHRHTEGDDNTAIAARQDLKSAYITSAVDLIFAAPRFNNHRVYVMAGFVPSYNLTTKKSEYLRLKRMQNFAEVGMGFDRYLPYFKCRPELKFMFGLGNALDMGHADELKDANMRAYAQSVSKGKTKMITLTLYFE